MRDDGRYLTNSRTPADSIALYGGPGRVPIESLKLVWLQLLSDGALDAISAAGGVRLLHAKFLFPTFYSPHNPKFDPVGSMWVRRDYGASYNQPIPNNTWVEVTHCGASSGKPGPTLDRYVLESLQMHPT